MERDTTSASEPTASTPSATGGTGGTARHVYGPRPVGTLVPKLARTAFRGRPAANAQVMLDWPMIVGPALSGMTEPRRLSAGTLTIACAGPIAMELQHMAMELMGRINTHLGVPTVRALRFVQVPPRAIQPPRPIPAQIRATEAARRAVGDLPPGPLRDALEALGGAVLASRKPNAIR